MKGLFLFTNTFSFNLISKVEISQLKGEKNYWL